MDFLAQLLEALNETESIAFLAFMLGAFLIGFLTARLLWGAKARKHYDQAQSLEHELLTIQTTQANQTKKLQEELATAHQRIRVLEATPPPAAVPAAADAALLRLQSIEDKLSRLESENTSLKATLEHLRSAPPPVATPPALEPVLELSLDDTPPTTAAPDTELLHQDETDEAREQARARILAAIGSVIPRAEAGERDALQQIEGIGPFLEGQLNELGICTYRQIAALDELLIPTLTEAIAFFPGRIERDHWVEQAQALLSSSSDE
jgi:predicted flap endonuclease-1-like 5' DNA nuclease